MKCEKLFQIIDELNESYIDIWEDVCNIESQTADKAGVDEVGRYFIRLAEKHGWAVETVPMERAGDAVCITMNPNAKGTPVSLSGHLDQETVSHRRTRPGLQDVLRIPETPDDKFQGRGHVNIVRIHKISA